MCNPSYSHLKNYIVSTIMLILVIIIHYRVGLHVHTVAVVVFLLSLKFAPSLRETNDSQNQ